MVPVEELVEVVHVLVEVVVLDVVGVVNQML